MSDLIEREEVCNALARAVPYVIHDDYTKAYMDGLADAYNIVKDIPTYRPWEGDSPMAGRRKNKNV